MSISYSIITLSLAIAFSSLFYYVYMGLGGREHHINPIRTSASYYAGAIILIGWMAISKYSESEFLRYLEVGSVLTLVIFWAFVLFLPRFVDKSLDKDIAKARTKDL